MNLTTATGARISEAAEVAGVSVRDLADTTGIPYTTLWRKLRGRAVFTVEDVAVLATALGVDATTLVPFGAVAS